MDNHTTLKINTKLSEEQVEELKKAAEALPEVKRQVETLKSLGMDVSELEDKIKWADQVQSTLLRDFS